MFLFFQDGNVRHAEKNGKRPGYISKTVQFAIMYYYLFLIIHRWVWPGAWLSTGGLTVGRPKPSCRRALGWLVIIIINAKLSMP